MSHRLTKGDENNPPLPVAMLRSNGNPAPLEKGDLPPFSKGGRGGLWGKSPPFLKGDLGGLWGKGGFERLFSGEPVGIGKVSPDTTLAQLLQRPEMDYTIIERLAPAGKSLSDEVKRRVEIEIKYDGYIRRQLQLIEKFKDMEDKRIPADFDYSSIQGLSREVIEKLTAIKPASLGQASRVPGVTPAAVSILAITLAKQSRRKG
ncbi:MAG: hypothetical protein HZA12_04105 [Nitrospirae bacterium]|nr:hypothetical protein [Nitrospirota bacterium]